MSDKKSFENKAVANQNKGNTHQKTSHQKTAAKANRKTIDTSEFKKWLIDLNTGVTPTVHVNGPSLPNESTAIISVDFGSPLSPVRLTNEQSQDITVKLKQLTREMYNGDVNVRVSFDAQNGIFWSSVA